MHMKMSSAKWRFFCFGLNSLTHWPLGHVAIHVISKVGFRKLLYRIVTWSFLVKLFWVIATEPYEKSILVQVMAWCR